MSRKPVAVLVAPSHSSLPRSHRSPHRRLREGIRIAAVGDIACKNPPGNNRQVASTTTSPPRSREATTTGSSRWATSSTSTGRYTGLRRQLRPLLRHAPADHGAGARQPRVRHRRRRRLLPVLRRHRHTDPDGYYSYDLGGWHVVALNSAICPAVTGCGPGDPQYEWLQDDLAANDASCTLAYWHHPRFDWLKYQNADWTEDYECLRSKPFWDLLSAARRRRRAVGPQPQLLAVDADGRRRQRGPERDPSVHRGLRRPQPERVRLDEHEARHVRRRDGERVRVPASSRFATAATTGGSCPPTAS